MKERYWEPGELLEKRRRYWSDPEYRAEMQVKPACPRGIDPEAWASWYTAEEWAAFQDWCWSVPERPGYVEAEDRKVGLRAAEIEARLRDVGDGLALVSTVAQSSPVWREIDKLEARWLGVWADAVAENAPAAVLDQLQRQRQLIYGMYKALRDQCGLSS